MFVRNLLAGLLAGSIVPAVCSAQFTFRDVATETGLLPAVAGIQGHCAGWGDADGDGDLDLYIGTFHQADGKSNLFLRNEGGKFRLDDQPALQLKARANSGLFVDLDNDGDLDLYASSMSQEKRGLAGCQLFQNDGKGVFTNISAGNGACPLAFGGRSATAFDFNGDGLLDLLVGEDPIAGYNGSTTTSSRLFVNRGNLQFADVSAEAGLTPGIPGLGVAAADVNGDGWPDFFLASKKGGNRLFLNDGKGKFAEAAGTKEVFDWTTRTPTPRGDDTSCGVAIGDVNRDGLPDLVVGHHFDRPWIEPVYNRLYLHRGVRSGTVVYEDVTEAVGLKPLPMKAPHVELQDFDNDGWPDVQTSMVKFVHGRPQPLIFRNLGVRDGLPRFEEKVLGLNDYPTPADRAIQGSGEFFKKMIAERKVIYSAPAPSGDFDNDGRLDIFVCNWWVDSPSMLLKNETAGGNWLKVEVRGEGKLNRQGIGAVVRVYPAGKLGRASELLRQVEISATNGYTSNQEAIAHFGLGAEESVDLEIILPHGLGKRTQGGVKANQRLVLAAP